MTIRIDLKHIERVAAILRDMLGEEWDEQAFLDTLDGEADTDDLADRLIALMREDAAMQDAVKAMEADLRARRQRFEARENAHRAALLDLLIAMGVKKLERPAATVSRRPGGVSLTITDERGIPTQMTKTTVAPDRAAIKAALQAGEVVPGAELARSGETLSVRSR